MRIFVFCLIFISVLFSEEKLNLSFLKDIDSLKKVNWSKENSLHQIIPNYTNYQGRGKLIKSISNLSNFLGYTPNLVTVSHQKDTFILQLMFHDTTQENIFNLEKIFNDNSLKELVNKISSIYGKVNAKKILTPYTKTPLDKKILTSKHYQWIVGNSTIKLTSLLDNSMISLSFSSIKPFSPFIELLCTLGQESFSVKIDKDNNKIYLNDTNKYSNILIKEYNITATKKIKKEYLTKELKKDYFIIEDTLSINRVNGSIKRIVKTINFDIKPKSISGKCEKYTTQKAF